jgi:hypothetical protein
MAETKIDKAEIDPAAEDSTQAQRINAHQVEHQNSLLTRAQEEAAIERARSRDYATLFSMQKAERDHLSEVRDSKIAKLASGASEGEAVKHVDEKFGLLGEISSEDAKRLQEEAAKKAQAVAKEAGATEPKTPSETVSSTAKANKEANK